MEVGRVGYGTMSLTGRGTWGDPADPAGARALLRRAAGLGVGLFDTADSYGPETAENLLREALHPYRDLLVATKGGFRRHGPHGWSADCRPEALRAACDGSLRRLGLERIDLYQGTISRGHLEENVGAAGIELSPDDVPALDRERLWSYRARRATRLARVRAGRLRRRLAGRVAA